MGKQAGALVGGVADQHGHAGHAGNHGRQAVPLFGVDDHVVGGAQGTEQFGRPVILEDMADMVGEPENGAVAFFGEDVNDCGRVC